MGCGDSTESGGGGQPVGTLYCYSSKGKAEQIRFMIEYAGKCIIAEYIENEQEQE